MRIMFPTAERRQQRESNPWRAVFDVLVDTTRPNRFISGLTLEELYQEAKSAFHGQQQKASNA